MRRFLVMEKNNLTSIINDLTMLVCQIENGGLNELYYAEDYINNAIKIESLDSKTKDFISDLNKAVAKLEISDAQKEEIAYYDNQSKEEYFNFAQTNRIADLIKEKYGIEPERNKDGFGTNGVFRNPETKKWIGLVMYKKRLNVTGDSEEKVEYLNLNLKKDADLYQGEGIYHPYKKQNKHWIVVIMDDSLSDQEIMDLVDISYEKSKQ